MRYAEPIHDRVLRDENELEIATRRVATIVESAQPVDVVTRIFRALLGNQNKSIPTDVKTAPIYGLSAPVLRQFSTQPTQMLPKTSASLALDDSSVDDAGATPFSISALLCTFSATEVSFVCLRSELRSFDVRFDIGS